MSFKSFKSELAACLNFELDIWYDRTKYGDAKSICNRCPVRTQCLNFAIENREAHGIWGGKSPWERRRIAAARKVLHGRD